LRTPPRIAALLLAAASLVGRITAQEPAAPLSGRLREVRIDARPIFGPEPRRLRLLADLVDTVHVTTKHETIARELWFAPGDVVGAATAAELERNLRTLGLFADVAVQLVPAPNDGEVDLEIRTKDHLTLSFGGGASYVGGVTGFRAALGESNLFGLGNRLVGSFARNSEGDYRGSVAYTDLHVLDTWHTATIRASQTDDGDAIGLEVRRPFKHLRDPRSYTTSAAYEETAVEYFRAGDSVAEVPDVRSALFGDLLWSDGPPEHRRIAGFELTVDHHDFDPAFGPLAAEIRVPGDTTSLFFGPTLRWQWIEGFRKVDGLDTLAYVQDLTLGTSLGSTLGARWRDEDGRDAEVQPEVSLFASRSDELVENVFTTVSMRGGLRWSGDEAAGWNTSAAARAFALPTRNDTLGASLAFDAVEERQDLPIELTLGEDNGLRGYTARAFAGTRRLRTNVENRFDTGLAIATLQFGIVLFHDCGWVGRGSDLGRPFAAAGVGLRIGSNELLGDGIVRIDLSKPLDDAPDGDDGWQLSVSVGQVFSFGGYTNTLSVR